MKFSNLRNSFNYVSDILYTSYRDTSFHISNFIYGNIEGVRSLYLFIIILFQVKNIINNNLLNDEIIINKLKDNVFNCGCISIKLAQWIISKLKGIEDKGDYTLIINKFENIFDNCKYHDINYTKNVFENDFNKKINTIFDMDTFSVLASGSIGQVYKGDLKKPINNNINNINTVVMKVKHPYIDYIKFYQMILIYFIIGMQKINYFKIKYKLHFNLYDFVDNINKQIDFNIEAYNCIKMYDNYNNNNLVVIPKVYNFSNNIIISSFEDGIFVDEVSEYQKCKISLNIMSLIYNMCLVDNFMHGDLHIKNWKVRPYKNTYQVILYDFGICFEGPSKEYNKQVLQFTETQDIKKLISLFLEDFNYDMKKEDLVEKLHTTFTKICSEPFNMNIVFNKLIYLFSTYNLIINNLYLNIILFFCLFEELWKKCNIICQNPEKIGIHNIVKNQKMDVITFCDTYEIYPELKAIMKEQLKSYMNDTTRDLDMFIRYKMSNFEFSNPDDISDDSEDDTNDITIN